MPLFTALGLLVAIPAIIGLVQEKKDQAIKIICGLAIALGMIVALEPHVDLLDQLLRGLWFKIAGVALAVLGCTLAVRLDNKIVGTCCACGGIIYCLVTLNVIRSFT